MATYTYGGRPGYEVRNRSGSVVLGILLEFYANHADATNRQNLLGTTTTDEQGQWSFLNAAGPTVWLRDPEGDAMAIEADDAGYALDADLAVVRTTANTAKSTADSALALAQAGGGGGGGGGTTVDLSAYYTAAQVGSAIGTASVTDRARANHTGTQSADTIVDGTTNHAFTVADDTKLAGIATGATVNDTDANLKARANHTGTQSADTIVDGTTNKVLTAADKTKISTAITSVTWSLVPAGTVGRLFHDGSVYPARPTPRSDVSFDWQGPVTPTAALSGVDNWINTAP